jgi:hypothetical protein
MKNTQPFVMVNNDLLATTLLNSTQKLFISFILGWQKSNLTCRMTNRNLAEHFGMKYAGIRSMLNKLNTYKFFETTQYGHNNDNSSWTSGHEMRVDEEKLIEFLKTGKSEKKVDEEIEGEIEGEIEPEIEGEIEGEIVSDNLEELNTLTKYKDDDNIDLKEVMAIMEFNPDEIIAFINHFMSDIVTFEQFCRYTSGLSLGQKREDFKGVRISDEQMEKLDEMSDK